MRTYIHRIQVNIDADAVELKSAEEEATKLQDKSRLLDQEIQVLQDQERNADEAYGGNRLEINELKKSLLELQSQARKIEAKIKETDALLKLQEFEDSKLDDEAKKLTEKIEQKILELAKVNGEVDNQHKIALYIKDKMEADQDRLKADKKRLKDLEHRRDKHVNPPKRRKRS